MGRSKLVRFETIAERSNVIEAGKPIFDTIRGNWKKEYFGNNHPIVMEIGCGRGEYTIGMANLFPNKNFIGVDIKGSRIWKGSTQAEEGGLSNVAFLRNLVENLESCLAPGEIDEVWVTFPDPRPRKGEEKKRLTSPRFLDLYQRLVKPGGTIHFKTDDTDLFSYTVETLQSRRALNLVYTYDLYASDLQHHTLNIQTTYEKRFLALGEKIKYLQFSC